jgi:6-pyruvoyltetrahydropterin/6-carboxytetrahydropterin synthase
MLNQRSDLDYLSTKTYTHSQGLSCTFRQWGATHSHCQFIHGYAIQVKLTFRATRLDDRNWVQDFGGLKPIKQWLESTFDHKLMVAVDDPKLKELQALRDQGLAQITEVNSVGCEAFAQLIFEYVEAWLQYQTNAGYNTFYVPGIGDPVQRVFLEQVEVSEHEGNSAIVRKRR